MDGINKQEAYEYVIQKMVGSEEFKGVEDEDIKRIAKEAMTADFEYMEKADIEEGGIYDEDDSFDYIMEKLTKGKDEETSMLISLIIDGYLEYFDEYLEKKDLIDWE